MKKISVIVCVFLNIYCFGYSQPFINLSKVWLMDRSNHSLPPEHQYDQLFFVKIGHDSIIEGIHYRKAIKTSDTLDLTWDTFGFIRETVDKKVYFRRFENGNLSKEKLLFDFNANIGDTLHNLYAYEDFDYPAVVTRIDSIELLEGKGRKITLAYIPNYYPIIEWVDIVGEFHGGLIPNPPIYEGSDSYLMKCFFDHGELIFNRPIIKPRYDPDLADPWVYDTIDVNCIYPNFSCLDTTSTIDTIFIVDTITYFDTIRVIILDSTSLNEDVQIFEDLNANIYPNPSNSTITIEFSRNLYFLSYSLINLSGLIVDSNEINNANVLELNVSEYLPGVYYLRIQFNGKTKTFEIIIQ